MKYRVKHIVEYGLLRGIAGLVGVLPYRVALAFGWGIARLVFAGSGSRRERTARRIRQVLGPERSEREVRDILWVAWRNLVFNAIETMRIPRVTLAWVKAHVLDYSEVEKLLALSKGGRGVVLAVPHMGNWELAGISAQLFGAHLTTIFRRQKNPLTDAYINRMREYTGVRGLETKYGAFHGIIRQLKEGMTLVILPDIRAKKEALRVNFLGAVADLPEGMALFAREAGVPILPAYVTRVGWARHRWTILDPVWPDPSLEKDADWRRMTQQVMDHFDRAIRANPDQYFWFNKRWVLGDDAK